MDSEQFDICIVGGGLAGLTAALACARSAGGSQARIALVAPAANKIDGRTTALLSRSVYFLDGIGVWDACKDEACPLEVMRIIDGSRRLIRAQPVDFRSSELGMEAFGYNIANAALSRSLAREIAGEKAITYCDAQVEEVTMRSTSVDLHLSCGKRLQACLAIGADGRKSLMREAAGIGSRAWDYGQTAIVATFSHRLPHDNISTEFHTESGPFTQVPLPANQEGAHRSSLVWVVRPQDAPAILESSNAELARLIERRMQSCFGAVKIEERPGAFPLSGMIALSAGSGRITLVGEAAHVFPPIGAQGFNLGLRDVEAITTLASDALMSAADPGADTIVAEYARSRRTDITLRTGAVDVLNRSLLTGFLPVQAGRAFGLELLAHNRLLRRFVMRHGMAPS